MKNIQNQYIAVGAGIVVVVLFFVFFGNFMFNTNVENKTMTDTNATSSTTGDQTASTTQAAPVTKLMITDEIVGKGALAVKGKTVSVHYVGTLLDGTKFDSSVDRGQPFEFTLGQNRVIQGWEQGILGMKVGGKRHLIIPSQLAYGNQAVGGVIPANATLVFEVELLGVK